MILFKNYTLKSHIINYKSRYNIYSRIEFNPKPIGNVVLQLISPSLL